MLFIISERVKKHYKIMDARSKELAVETLEKAMIENSRMIEILNFPDLKYKKIYLDENIEIFNTLKLIG